jgi:hypothetical protein
LSTDFEWGIDDLQWRGRTSNDLNPGNWPEKARESGEMKKSQSNSSIGAVILYRWESGLSGKIKIVVQYDLEIRPRFSRDSASTYVISDSSFASAASQQTLPSTAMGDLFDSIPVTTLSQFVSDSRRTDPVKSLFKSKNSDYFVKSDEVPYCGYSRA